MFLRRSINVLYVLRCFVNSNASLVAKHYGTMAICLEVNTDSKLSGLVMQMFDTSRCARYWNILQINNITLLH